MESITLQKTEAFNELMTIRAFPEAVMEKAVVTGADPFFRTPFRIGETVSSVLTATGIAINDIWALRGHDRQTISVSLAEAAATLRSMDYTRARGNDGVYRPVPPPAERAHVMDLCRPYRTRDGRWFVPHFSLGLGAEVLDLLGCDDNAEAIGKAITRWDAAELEEAIASAGACGGIVRTREQWLAHPHGIHLTNLPVVKLTRTGPAKAQSFHPGDRPLSGVRVLDLTRIIAGPVGSRGLAEYGADVLMVTAQELIQAPEHVRDTSQSKRSCFLNLKSTEGAARFAELVKEADVVVSSYRPGALAALGFGTEELARMRPGIVQVSVSCFGSSGPFAERRGWEQIAQAVTGVCHTQGAAIGANQPQIVSPLVCDFTTGYLATYGALLALGRRAREGGSWHIDVSLCRSSMFLQSQGLLNEFDAAPQTLSQNQLDRLYVQENGVYGDIKTLGPVLNLSDTPPCWYKSTPKLGADAPIWLPR